MKNPCFKTGMALVTVLLGIFSFTVSAVADVVVIVNLASGVSSLSTKEIKKIFPGEKKKLPDGNNGSPVGQDEGSAMRSVFNDSVLSKSSNPLKVYGSKIIFSGKGSPPDSMADSVADNTAVKSWGAEHKNGIGYVDSSQVDASVKVVLTVK